MTKSIRGNIWQYDLFVSYARFDDDLTGFVEDLTRTFKSSFHELTGLEARVFVDNTEITSAMLWETRIRAALSESAVLIVVETPSYYTSEWCQQELDTFLIMEAQRRDQYQLLPYESLIFPVLRRPLDYPIEFDGDQQRRVREVRARQSADLTGLSAQDSQYRPRVERLVADTVSVLRKLMQPDFSSLPLKNINQALSGTLAPTTPLVTTYSSPDNGKLCKLLTEAQAVTIVGISKEDIADALEIAITRKRENTGDRTAFWDHLHIVFLAEELIPYVDDGLSSEFPNRSLAFQERIRRAALSRRRLMSQLLRNGASDRWTLYTYPYLLPFAGILFEMPDGKRVVQLRMMRPSRYEADHLKIDFIDRVDQFFESAFREVVGASSEEHEIVLVGVPAADYRSFRCRGSRFRRSVLVENRSISDWIAAVVAVTWRSGRAGPEPLLQVNTPRNSTREMGKASHVSGYINAGDHVSPANDEGQTNFEDFVIPRQTAETAVRRELAADFGIHAPGTSVQFLSAEPFYYPDKENLFFYVFTGEIDPTHQFTSDVQMFGWSVDELIRVRRHHVLTNAKLALISDLTERQRLKASELIVANLIAQGDEDLAKDVGQAVVQGGHFSALETRLDAELEESRTFKYTFGRELEVQGLAGLQYRIFYSVLLPAYAALGMDGAKQHLEEISQDPRRLSAMGDLRRIYGDPDYMTALPIEV